MGRSSPSPADEVLDPLEAEDARVLANLAEIERFAPALAWNVEDDLPREPAVRVLLQQEDFADRVWDGLGHVVALAGRGRVLASLLPEIFRRDPCAARDMVLEWRVDSARMVNEHMRDWGETVFQGET